MNDQRCQYRDPEIPLAPQCPSKSAYDSIYCAAHRLIGWKAAQEDEKKDPK